MDITVKGKRGGTKTLRVNTVAQLTDAVKRVPHGYDRKHDQMMMVGLFVAERLVAIELELTGGKVRRHTRPTEWNRFFAAGMRAGKSPSEIGAEWQARKVRKVS